MAGYMEGDEQSYRLYFRVSQRQFNLLHSMIRTFPVWSTVDDASRTPAQRRRESRRRVSLAHHDASSRGSVSPRVYMCMRMVGPLSTQAA